MTATNPWLALPEGGPTPVLTRGLRAAHEALVTRGGTPFFRVDDTFQSWIDTTSLSSLRF